MALEDAKNGDAKVSVDGFNFLVEEDLTDMYDSFTVDYNDSWLRKGFLVYPANGSPDSGC